MVSIGRVFLCVVGSGMDPFAPAVHSPLKSLHSASVLNYLLGDQVEVELVLGLLEAVLVIASGTAGRVCIG